MFTASSFSILNYDTDFFDLMRKTDVKVHIADVASLGANGAVHLSDGTKLQADAFCCVTGWKWTAPLKFLPEGIDAELGVPHHVTPNDPVDLVEKADKEILTRFPRLSTAPPSTKSYVPLPEQEGIHAHSAEDAESSPHSTALTPWTLHRFLVPASPALQKHRDIAFAGFMMNFNTTTNDHIQALWINAYFLGQGLSLPNLDDDEERNKMRYETVLYSRFGKWRYPAGRGSQFPDMVFDALPYVDLLARDLGVRVHRKGGGVKEWYEPYGPEDYSDVVQEWKEKHHASLS